MLSASFAEGAYALAACTAVYLVGRAVVGLLEFLINWFLDAVTKGRKQ